MYEPSPPKPPKIPVKKLQVLAAASFAGFVIFAILVIVLALQVITLRRHISDKIDQNNSLSATIEKQADEILKVKRAQIANNQLPPLESFNKQCPGSNTDDALFTSLSPTPIENYNVFLVDCRSYISTGKSLPRVIIFRVNGDGSKELTYAANDLEPLCITNKLPVANTVADKLSMPVCQAN